MLIHMLLAGIWRDFRFALRGFRRAPTFTIAILATIGLGLGLNAVAFTLFNAYFLRPLEVRDPGSLYDLQWIEQANGMGRAHRFTLTDYTELQGEGSPFPEVLAYRPVSARIEGRQAAGQFVSGNYFRMLGVATEIGRPLMPEDAKPPGEPVVVISDTAWRRWFGSDPGAIGRRVWILGYPFTVIGVARKGFRGVSNSSDDFWVPVTSGDNAGLQMIGRVGSSVEQARAGFAVWAQRIPGSFVRMSPRKTRLRLTDGELLSRLPVFVSLVLLLAMACSNVANMMMARSLQRSRETAIRLSLGAERRHIVRQRLVEGVTLGVLASLIGLWFSRSALRVGVYLLSVAAPGPLASGLANAEWPLDWRVFGFLTGMAMLAVLLFGVVPAVGGTVSNVNQIGKPARRQRGALVAVQVAACTMLMISTSIALRGFEKVLPATPRINVKNVLRLGFHGRFRQAGIDVVASNPAVQGVAAARFLPWSGSTVLAGSAESGNTVRGGLNYVSPGFFALVDLPVRSGRNFSEAEAESGEAVAIIGRTVAETLWPHGGAIGRSVRLEPFLTREPLAHQEVRIIGIVDDANSELSGCYLYLPTSLRDPSTAMLVRTRGGSAQAQRRIEQDLEAQLPGALDAASRLEEEVSGRQNVFRAMGWMAEALGALALLLMLGGIYSVLAYLVEQRKQDIAIHIALGSPVSRVVWATIGNSCRISAAGFVAGILGTVVLSGILRASFPGFNGTFDTTDPFDYCLAAGVVLLASGVAAWIPSMRAARVDPATLLRHE